MRFFLLGIPHAITHRDYSTCAFTQKIVKFAKMMRARGHEIIHFGHEDSELDCDEHVTVATREDMERSYPGWNWRTQGHPPFDITNEIYLSFYGNAVREIRKRQRPLDILLCFWGAGHKPVADHLSDIIVVEPGIGYPGGSFAPYRVFESYAVMHATMGSRHVAEMSNSIWYDAVIPNYFDLDDFDFSAEKDDHLLFLGRVDSGKGITIAVQIAEATGKRLVVAGPGRVGEGRTRTDRPLSDYVVELGVVGPDWRRSLLSRAKAVVCPSLYLEPFCGVHVEAMLSGTPVITTDFGAFAEYNLHGLTGYRCRTFEQFAWAARNIDRISPQACRDWGAANFSLDRIGAMYDEYFRMVLDVHTGSGWYQDRPYRSELDWLNQAYPVVR